MALRRFYVDPSLMGESICLSGDLFHHVRDVCRFGPGDQFELLPGDGQAWLVEIVSMDKRQLMARRLSGRRLPELPRPWITLALSIPKLPKVDWIIEESVELGVHEIRPFVSDYSFLRKVSEVSDNRLARWRKLVQAAAQQSGRGDLMGIRDPIELLPLLETFNRSPQTGGLFPYEGESQLSLRQALTELKAKQLDHIWVFIGSEGGFSRTEVDLFARHGLQPVTLGEQILRVETACVALTSVIKYEYEQFEYGSIR